MNEIRVRMEDRSYVIDSAFVMEIVPLVHVDTAETKPHIAGTVNYRGNVLTVIDLCSLFLGRPYQKKFSTRILIIRNEGKLFGLIAENLTDLTPVDEKPLQRLDLQQLSTYCL